MEEKIIAIIADELSIDASELSAESSMETVDGWDSLIHMAILESIENSFHINLPIDAAAEAGSVSKLAEMVKGLI